MQFIVKTLSLETNIPADFDNIKKMRNTIGNIKNIPDHFHNHNNQGGKGEYIYAYPQIHYTIVNKVLKITAYNQSIAKLIALYESNEIVRLFKEAKVEKYPLQGVQEHYVRIDALQNGGGFTQVPYSYLAHHYIPFNNNEYDIYKSFSNYMGRVAYVQQKLAKHIQYVVTGLMDADIKNTIQKEISHIPIYVELEDIDAIEKAPLLHDELATVIEMRLRFRTNILLPTKVAIGNDVALGKGQIEKLK